MSISNEYSGRGKGTCGFSAEIFSYSGKKEERAGLISWPSLIVGEMKATIIIHVGLCILSLIPLSPLSFGLTAARVSVVMELSSDRRKGDRLSPAHTVFCVRGFRFYSTLFTSL